MSSVESCQVLQISSLFTDELFTTQVSWLGCHIHKIWAFYEDSILRTTKKPDHRCWARFYVRLWNFIQVKKIRRRFIYPLNVNPLNVNPTKWSNTFKQFVGKSRQIIWVWPFWNGAAIFGDVGRHARGGLAGLGGAGWWLPCLASGGNSCRLWQLGRSGWVLFPWVRVGPIFVRIGPFRGFLALLPRSSFWWGDWGLGYHSVV